LGKEIDAWVLHARARKRFSIAKPVNYARDWQAKGREFSTQPVQKRGKTEWVLQQHGGNQIRNPNTEIRNTRSGGADFEAQSRKSPNFGLRATCVAGGRECGWARRAALARPLPLKASGLNSFKIAK